MGEIVGIVTCLHTVGTVVESGIEFFNDNTCIHQ